MKHNLKQILISLLLFGLVVFLVFFNLNYFLNAPKVQEERFINSLAQSLNSQYEDQVAFHNEFALEQPMYVFSSPKAIYVVSQDYKLLYRLSDGSKLDANKRYGLYREQLVIVEKQGTKERFLDFKTAEEVFSFDRSF